MSRKIALGMVMAFLVSSSLASQSLFEILGGQKVGTTSMVLLKMGLGARAIGLGNTYVSIAQGGEGLWWNPAGSAFESEECLEVSHVNWVTGINIEHVGLVLPLKNYYSSVGVQLASLVTPVMERTDEYHPFGTGEYFAYGVTLIGVSFSRLVSDRFSAAVGVKAFNEVLDDMHSYGVALDFATLYKVGYKDIKIGVALSNLGPDVKPKCAECSSFSLPIVYRLGASGNPWKPLKIAFQIDKPSDNVELFKFGAELTPIKPLTLRWGYQLNARGPADNGLNGLSAGFTIRVMSLRLDYAYRNWGYFGETHTIGINIAR